MLLTRLLLLWRRLTVTYLFSPTGLRAAGLPVLGGVPRGSPLSRADLEERTGDWV
jgi:hypothetical protein